jgi:fructose-specific phosphotransferase system component IIB
MSNTYHVGCGLGAIYAGTLRSPGVWGKKNAVTNEAVSAAAQYLLDAKLTFTFNARGKKYRMAVVEVDEPAKEAVQEAEQTTAQAAGQEG